MCHWDLNVPDVWTQVGPAGVFNVGCDLGVRSVSEIEYPTAKSYIGTCIGVYTKCDYVSQRILSLHSDFSSSQVSRT